LGLSADVHLSAEVPSAAVDTSPAQGFAQSLTGLFASIRQTLNLRNMVQQVTLNFVPLLK